MNINLKGVVHDGPITITPRPTIINVPQDAPIGTKYCTIDFHDGKGPQVTLYRPHGDHHGEVMINHELTLDYTVKRPPVVQYNYNLVATNKLIRILNAYDGGYTLTTETDSVDEGISIGLHKDGKMWLLTCVDGRPHCKAMVYIICYTGLSSIPVEMQMPLENIGHFLLMFDNEPSEPNPTAPSIKTYGDAEEAECKCGMPHDMGQNERTLFVVDHHEHHGIAGPEINWIEVNECTICRSRYAQHNGS
jgi:hypothetical protein